MVNFKRNIGKVGKIKKDFGIDLDTIINKNLEILSKDILELRDNLTHLKVKKAKIQEILVNLSKEIDNTDLDGEKVMMNLDKGEYFMMNEVGSRIWEIISEPVNVKGIIDTLRSEYEVDEETCKDTVVEFLGRLNNADLISIS